MRSSLAQLQAEACRFDRIAELHGENVTRWLILKEQQKELGNLETSAEFGLMALKAEVLAERASDRAHECRMQIARLQPLVSLAFDVTARTIRAA